MLSPWRKLLKLEVDKNYWPLECPDFTPWVNPHGLNHRGFQMELVTAKGNKIDYYHFYIELPSRYLLGHTTSKSPSSTFSHNKEADYHNVIWIFIIVLNEDFSSSSQEGDRQKAMQSKLQEGGLQDGQLHLGCIYRSVAYISGIKEERQLGNYISNFMKF